MMRGCRGTPRILKSDTGTPFSRAGDAAILAFLRRKAGVSNLQAIRRESGDGQDQNKKDPEDSMAPSTQQTHRTRQGTGRTDTMDLRRAPGETAQRLARLRSVALKHIPDVDGFLLGGRANIGWLTGTFAAGLTWVPMEGNPVLFVRKGRERALEESDVSSVVHYRSFRELEGLAAEAGSPLGRRLAVDMDHFSWTMADMLRKRLGERTFVAADAVLARARAVKTEHELAVMRVCGQIHADVLDGVFPEDVAPGLSEAEIAFLYVDSVLARGGDGLARMNAHGEEMFFGYASVGESGLHPTYYNGPLGCRGLDAGTPFLGDRGVVWKRGQLLTVDMACTKAGYHTDRTQCYWSGPASSMPGELVRAQSVCREILDSSLELLRPGVTPADLWTNALEIARKRGFEDRFMGVGEDRVPFLGHGVGLNLDEWPAVARSFNEPFEEGMCMALEPKIGLPGLGMTGVEHTYVVTRGEPHCLTGGRTDIICL